MPSTEDVDTCSGHPPPRSMPVVLPNRGGIVTLLDASGLKVDGAAYTREQAAEPGRTIAF